MMGHRAMMSKVMQIQSIPRDAYRHASKQAEKGTGHGFTSCICHFKMEEKDNQEHQLHQSAVKRERLIHVDRLFSRVRWKFTFDQHFTMQ